MPDVQLLLIAKAPVPGRVKTRLCPPATPVQAAALQAFDAVLGPAADGGWWALGLREPSHAGALVGVPMSTEDTGARTLEALRGRGLRIGLLPELRDVDTADDAHAVAALCRHG